MFKYILSSFLWIVQQFLTGKKKNIPLLPVFSHFVPHGFEVQDIRLGGLIQRIKHCRKRLEAYLRGEEEILPELEEVLLDFWGHGMEYCKDTPCYPDWSMIVTANQLH